MYVCEGRASLYLVLMGAHVDAALAVSFPSGPSFWIQTTSTAESPVGGAMDETGFEVKITLRHHGS